MIVRNKPTSRFRAHRHGTCSIDGENRIQSAVESACDRSRFILLEAVMRHSTFNAAVTHVVAGALALLATPFALALSLGEAAPQSSLGQPLRVAVPISAVSGQSLTAACVHVIADAAGGSGPPRLLTGRVTIDRGTAGPQLLVTTARPVDEPVVRLAVQAGCEGSTRRDYVLLLDPPSAGAKPSLAQRSADTQPVAVATAPSAGARPLLAHRRIDTQPAAGLRATHPKAGAIDPVISITAVAPSTPVAATIAAAEAAPKPTILPSSPGGSSFIPEASAAGLPRASSGQSGLSTADAEPPVAPWWPLAAALLVVAALARWLVPMRHRSATNPPAWVTPTARTEPNPSVSGRSPVSRAGKPGYFAAMTEPGPGFPRGASNADRGASRVERSASRSDPTPSKPTPAAAAAIAQSTREDPRFANFDADLIEEQTIRAEWAKAVTDGAIDMGGDSILKAIDDAERAIQGGPAHPAQVALDRSLDDELLPNKAPR